MKINDFANIVKRETRYGLPSNLADQATLDILAEINVRRKRMWRRHDWAWHLEPLSFAIIQGTTTYLVSALSGNLIDRITDLIPQDPTTNPQTWGQPLKQLERQDFYTWWAAQPNQNTPDIPTNFTNLGLDTATGKWKIELAPSPASGFTMKGFAKPIIATYTITDIQNNTEMDYFPDGMDEDILLDGVKAGIFDIQGDARGALYDKRFEDKLTMLVKDQNNAGHDDSGIKTPVPDAYRFLKRYRNRGGTSVV